MPNNAGIGNVIAGQSKPARPLDVRLRSASVRLHRSTRRHWPGRPSFHSDSNSAISTPMTRRRASSVAQARNSAKLSPPGTSYSSGTRPGSRDIRSPGGHRPHDCPRRLPAAPAGSGPGARTFSTPLPISCFSCGSRSRAPTRTMFDMESPPPRPVSQCPRRTGNDHAPEVGLHVRAGQSSSRRARRTRRCRRSDSAAPPPVWSRVQPRSAPMRSRSAHHAPSNPPRVSARACRSARAADSCSSHNTVDSGALRRTDKGCRQI